ncbi:MAG: preprotein translocase subunit YajC [Acidimicrobiales bacterium]
MPTTHAFFAVLMAKTSTQSGSSAWSLLIFVGLIGLVFVFMRSRSQAARRQRDTLMELSAGDEVLTAAGIYGTVLDVEPDRVTLETAPGTRITVVRSTIARRIVPQDVRALDGPDAHHENAHGGVAEAAGWHDPTESNSGGDPAEEHDAAHDEPEAGGAPGEGQGGGR